MRAGLVLGGGLESADRLRDLEPELRDGGVEAPQGRADELSGTPNCVLEPGESRTFAVRIRLARI